LLDECEIRVLQNCHSPSVNLERRVGTLVHHHDIANHLERNRESGDPTMGDPFGSMSARQRCCTVTG